MIPVFLGCETSDDIGVQYQLDSGASVNFIEFELEATNIIVDSLRTDSENRILVGSYNDDLVGSVVAESYFTLRVRSTNIPSNAIGEDFTLDSVRMVLESPSSIPLASERLQSFDVHLLEDTLSNVVYLASKSEVIGDQVGSYETTFSTSDTLVSNFLLDNSFALSIFNNLEVDESVLTNTDWPTMAVVPTSSSQSINEVSLLADTTGLYLYVTDPDGIEIIVDNDTSFRDTTYVVEFSFSASSNLPGYVHLDRDKSGTPFANLSDNDTLELSNGTTVIDPLAGTSTRLSVEPLEDFFKQLEREERAIIINNAAITFAFENEESRDTLENFYSFIYRDNDFFGPGLVTNQLNSIILSDNAFLQGQNLPAVSAISDERTEVVLTTTLFFQQVYNEFINDESDVEEKSITVEEFVLISQNDITLQRSIIQSDGIKLRMYYTEVN